MRADLNDPPSLHGDDSIRVPDGRQAVSNNENGAAFTNAFHIRLYDLFRLIIESTCRLIEDKNTRVRNERSGDCDALALTAGQRRAALAYDCIVASGKTNDEFMCSCEGGRLQDTIKGDFWMTVSDVLSYATIEKNILLKDDADLTP